MTDPPKAIELFGARVLRERATRHWSTRDLAVKAGVAFSTINRIENARGDVWLSAAVRIAEALGLSLDGLVSEPVCSACDGAPPAGFTCNHCGRTRD